MHVHCACHACGDLSHNAHWDISFFAQHTAGGSAPLDGNIESAQRDMKAVAMPRVCADHVTVPRGQANSGTGSWLTKFTKRDAFEKLLARSLRLSGGRCNSDDGQTLQSTYIR